MAGLPFPNLPGVWVAGFVLAGLVGFVADRSSTCTVRATEEVLATGRAHMLASFGKIVLWVVGASYAVEQLYGSGFVGHLSYGMSWATLGGGVIFGLGAVVNGGCALATLKRFGNGDLGMLCTFAGFAVGVAAAVLVEAHIPRRATSGVSLRIDMPRSVSVPGGVALALWMLHEIVGIWRASRGRVRRAFWHISQYRLATVAAIIGISNGILYAAVGSWSYTYTMAATVRQFVASGNDDPASTTVSWLMPAGLVMGIVASAWLRRGITIAWRPSSACNSFLAGGTLMGFGAVLIPGGNDVLLLHAMPGMSPHAIPAYLSILLGVAAGLYVHRWRGHEWQAIDCSSGVCKSESAQ